MKKLNWLVGEWRGKGWYLVGQHTREEFTNHENVQPKLDGLVLVVEGLGKKTDKETGKEKVAHNALGFLSYDANEKGYRWKTFTMEGYSNDTTAQIGEKSFIWGYKSQWGDVRYTITLNDKGNWLEIGELSRDGGKTWWKNFEMELEKVK